MTFKISGFGADAWEKKRLCSTCESDPKTIIPRKSMVQIRFPGKGMALSYYNDQFDLKRGDLVYVEGKMEGQLGRVVEISYNFKIRISEYKKVIAVCDTQVSGQLFLAGSHFVTFDPSTLPAAQISLWFKAPAKEDEEYASSSDDTTFPLDDLTGMKLTEAIAERGRNYYKEARVRYLCLDGAQGYAIVEGTETYTVEFEYHNGQISELVCDCYCSYPCKHQVAAMLQLRETLELIDQHYSHEYQRTGYFAAITKGTLFSYAIDTKETGSFTL